MRPPAGFASADLSEAAAAALSPAVFGYLATKNDPLPYQPARFHRVLSDAVVDVVEGLIDILIVQLPVQHGKTETASRLGAAWFLGTHPDKWVSAVSYSSEFAAD